jgi:PKD repeat protein/Tol biopolymer transport system component
MRSCSLSFYFNFLIYIFCLSILSACGQSELQNTSPATSKLAESESEIASFVIEPASVIAAVPDIVGEISRSSIDTNEQEADGNSINASISQDGRYVVFDSIAANLVTNDNNSTWDIYLRDRLNQVTIRLTTSSSGGDSDGASIDPVISDDGTTIVFSSSATNLVEDDANHVADIFRFDVLNNDLLRITASQENNEGNNDSDAPDISADGRYIVYESNATNLTLDEDNNGVTDVFIYDSQTGETERVSVNSEDEEGNGISRNPSVSDDGRFIVFDSQSNNLVDSDNNNVSDIFLRDRLLGETYRVNINDESIEANGSSSIPVISGIGTVIAYSSVASNLVENDNNSVRDIFVRDLISGTTSRVSVSNSGAEGDSTTFSSLGMDASGRYIVFYSEASNLVDSDANLAWDVFIHDRELRQTSLASIDANGQQGNASSFVPAISAGGHYVVFGSGADNLVSEDNNESWDTFTRVVIQPNRVPVADAGDDAEIFLGESLNLDGSNSSDPDEPTQQLSYFWNVESAPPGSVATIAQDTAVDAVFTPDTTGEYIISLIVNDGEVDSVADEIMVTVVENLSPQAIIEASVTSGDAPLMISFNGSNSSDPEGAQLLYHWDFADPESLQNSSSQESDTHIFNQPGQYTVALTVTDDFGQTNQAIVVINVTAPNLPPTIQVIASPSSGTIPLTVEFMSNAIDEDGDTLSYLWSFGDGSSSTEINPVHEFQQEGIFEVSLTVSDGNFETQDFVQVTVGASFDLVTRSARLELNNKKQFKDKIHFKARFDASSVNLMPSDVIRVSVNQVILFEQPLSAFYGGDEEKNLIYREKHNHVKLNLADGYIKLSKHKASLSDIDAGDPVNIELVLGSQVSNETIQFVHLGHERFKKNHHDKHENHYRNKSVKKDIYIYRASGGKLSDHDHHKHHDSSDRYHKDQSHKHKEDDDTERD